MAVGDFQNKVLQSLLYGFLNINKAGFKLLLRRDNFAPVGIITVKRAEVDSAHGMPRTWAEGVLIEQNALERGKFFREPLDRYNTATGMFESTVLCENQYGVVLTARRSFSLDDDGDGFMWLDNPLEVAEFMKVKEDKDAKTRIISSLKSDVESVREELNFWKDAAGGSGAEARDVRERLGTLQRKTYLLQSQIDYYKLEAMVAEGLNIQVESAVRKITADAKERGIELASTDSERVLTSMDNLKKQREKMAALMPAGAVSEEELKKIRAQLGDLSRQLEGLAKPSRAEAKPKPPTEAKPPTTPPAP